MSDEDFLKDTLGYRLKQLEQAAIRLGAHSLLAQLDQKRAEWDDRRDAILFGDDDA